MESGNGSTSSKGVLTPVSTSSDVFENSILAPLRSAYLSEESQHCFRYKSAVLIKNPALEKKYDAFRVKKRKVGYSEEDLKESFGFLLFDDINKAEALGETGVLTGNSTCTTLGDPSNGVYISMYSDCLDLNHWYHGKSGYIAIIRLTKGRVKEVLENYTQHFTAPTAGFDCHVSEQLPSISARSSSFLAFEKTQYYMYELLDDGSNGMAQSPSAACPYAIVSFSYLDTNATFVAPQVRSEERKLVCHYFPWRGQLQIGTHFFDIGLRYTSGDLIPAKLPPVLKVDRAISMLDLRQLLPRAVFETCFSGEVFLDGFYCSLSELIPSEVEQTSSLSMLLWEIKKRDVGLTIPLNDGGFLILLHSSHFLTYDDTGSSATEVLQGMFVFPDSRVIHKDTKFGWRKSNMSSEILPVLPMLSYAEGEVEKTPIPSENLCEVYAQHMQNYAALINPGLTLSPSRNLSTFPDQYDVLDVHKHLYTSPEWTDGTWQSFRSYLSKPASFQLPVSSASDILVAGQEEQIQYLDDDVYICLSSPEEASANPCSSVSEDQLTVDSGQVDIKVVPQTVVPDDSQNGDSTKDSEKSDLPLFIKPAGMQTKDGLTPSTADDLPAELILSITSAERTVTDAGLSVINTESTTKHPDQQLSGFSTVKLQTAGVNCLDYETVRNEKVFESPERANLKKTKRRKRHRRHYKRRKRVSKACVETPSLQTVKMLLEDDNPKSLEEDQAKESSGHQQLSNSSNRPTQWIKVRRRKRRFGKLLAKKKKLTTASVGLEVAEETISGPGEQSSENTVLMKLKAGHPTKKIERWDIKPVRSESGRFLVPYGSVDIADWLKALMCKPQSGQDETCPEKMSIDAPVNAHDTVEMESSTAPKTTVDKAEATPSEDRETHPPNVIVSHVIPEDSILRQSDDGNGSPTFNPECSETSLKSNAGDTSDLKTDQEKHIDAPSPGKCATKGEFLLNKLKTVLLRGKRKTEEMTDTAQDTEPCLKKGKVDSHPGMQNSNDASVQDTNLGVKAVSKVSVDPHFAYVLGLTHKETPDKTHELDHEDAQQRTDSSETQEQTILDIQPKVIQKPLSISQRMRIKTLRKHQSISAECVKEKWWLHFQTPASFASEKLTDKGCIRDNSETFKEKSNGACSPSDALNLLADLALSANYGQLPPQPDQALERKPETSLKKCDLTKEDTIAEQESVLHTLLREPAARPIQALESPSPSRLLEGSELVGLISKEHAYSLPPSSFLLLDLSGTSFQVSPLSGSTRLLHHHHTMHDDGIKTLHPTVDQEDRSEHKRRTPEYQKKHTACIRKFRHSRTFVTKDGSVQVTKQWKENYDFNLDSKFASDSESRTTIRALHGPWDFSIQDTSEEVQLIVHMWIGLFYSRSTARFFHLDSNCANPCSEETESLEVPCGMVSAPAQSELKANSFATCPNATGISDTVISKALDLSKKDNSALDQGSVILDLSLRNSNADIVTADAQGNQKETSVSAEKKEENEPLNTLKSPVGLHKCHRSVINHTEMINEFTDESKRTSIPLQKAGRMEHAGVSSFKGDGSYMSVQEEKERTSVTTQKHQNAPGIGHVLHECNNEKTDMKGGSENSSAMEMHLVQKQRRNSSKCAIDKEEDSNKKAGDVHHTIEHYEIESKDAENLEVKEKSYQDSNIETPEMIHTGNDSTNKESNIVCSGNLLENAKQSSREEPEALSPEKTENLNEDMDCFAVDEDNMIKDDHFGKDDSALTDEHAISEKAPDTSSDMESVCSEPVVEENKDAHYQRPLLPISDESTCSLDWPSSDGSVSQTNDGVEIESQNKLITNFSLSSDDQDTKSVEGEQDIDGTTQKELYHRSRSPQCEAITRFEEELEATKTDVKSDKTNESLKKFHNLVVIPFIGIDTSGEDPLQPYDSHSEGSVEEVQDQKEMSLITETTFPKNILPIDVCSTSHTELSAGKTPLSLLDGSEICQPVVSGSEADDPCLTLTMDETPHQNATCYGPISGSSSSLSDNETCKNVTQKCLTRSSTLIEDEMPLDQKHTSTVNSDTNPPCGLHTDFEQRTRDLSTESQTNKSSQIQTADIKQSLYQTDRPQETSTWQDFGDLHRSFPSAECLQAFKPNTDQVGHKTISQTNFSYEPRSYSQRPVMAVKPSKSDDIKVESLSEDRGSVMSFFSINKSTKTPIVTNTVPPSMLLEKKTQSLGGNSAGLNDGNGEASELSLSSWLSNASDTTSNSDKAKFALLHPLHQYKERDFLEFNIPSSTLPVHSSESPETSKLIDGNQSFLTDALIEKVGETTKENIEVDQKGCSDASTIADYKDDSIIDDSLLQEPQCSLTRTVLNTSQNRSDSFLEQLSKRCLQDDLTQASMEQECLIFSEQMRQLLKRSKRGPLHQLDTRDKPKLSCANPMTLHFSNLEEQDDSVNHLDTPSLVGQKIKVDMFDRKALVDSAEGKNTWLPQKLSQGTDNTMQNAGVSGVSAECTRLYTTMMNDVCAVKKIPSRPKHLRMDNSTPKTEPSIHFAFCEQMKREFDEILWSNLNSSGKNSCKMKYRFFILVTSDDAFFGETKAQLEAEGHTAVQPSEFFVGEDESSPLLIILKNVDIVEHLCEIPHLLQLKKSPFVQFAGIDEPDDVVNLTHQELLIRGGFIMFDRAALESISLCNMKQMLEILHELSSMGKWKWMLHYRDSRRLKENARFSAEAKEKKLFLNQCQEDGILEVLPYHECDLMSRDQPDYLTCLVHLQVQNISARCAVFITDTTDSSFEKNGILTMTLTSILTCSPSETFTT